MIKQNKVLPIAVGQIVDGIVGRVGPTLATITGEVVNVYTDIPQAVVKADDGLFIITKVRETLAHQCSGVLDWDNYEYTTRANAQQSAPFFNQVWDNSTATWVTLNATAGPYPCFCRRLRAYEAAEDAPPTCPRCNTNPQTVCMTHSPLCERCIDRVQGRDHCYTCSFEGTLPYWVEGIGSICTYCYEALDIEVKMGEAPAPKIDQGYAQELCDIIRELGMVKNQIDNTQTKLDRLASSLSKAAQ